MQARTSLLLIFLVAVQIVSAQQERELPLTNGGFEEGLSGWSVTGGNAEGFVNVTQEAASLGEKGLRVTFPANSRSLVCDSSPIVVTPGKSYRVDIWAGGTIPRSTDVVAEMVFRDSKGAILKADKAYIRKWPAAKLNGNFFFDKKVLAAAAPEGAETLTLQFKTWGTSAAGPVDVDDIRIFELPDDPDTSKPVRQPGQGNPIPETDPADITAWLNEIHTNPTRGKEPPKIVLKLDDFKPANGSVHPRWLRVADLADERGIKLNFGIIAEYLQEDAPEFLTWTKARHSSGQIEFWFHGWDHSREGQVMEFYGRPKEYQKQHVADSQNIAKEKLGFPFRSFGAPFNATDDITTEVIGEDPDIAVWMYGVPGKTGDKLTLERSWVNLETPTIIANYGAFIEGYAHNRGAPYFVLQGHPAGWDDERFEQFAQIVNFLISQNVEFVHASEFADRSDLRNLVN